MLDSLGLDPAADYTTLEWLGNTGSVALPITMALGAESGFLQAGDKVGMLGIGSGINCVMLAVEWETSLVRGSGQVGEHKTLDIWNDASRSVSHTSGEK